MKINEKNLTFQFLKRKQLRVAALQWAEWLGESQEPLCTIIWTSLSQESVLESSTSSVLCQTREKKKDFKQNKKASKPASCSVQTSSEPKLHLQAINSGCGRGASRVTFLLLRGSSSPDQACGQAEEGLLALPCRSHAPLGALVRACAHYVLTQVLLCQAGWTCMASPSC